MYSQLLTILLLCLTCNGYEDDDLRQALGGGLSQGMDDLMESLGQAIDGLVDMAEGKSFECVYKCENGKKAKPNPDHVPKSNGCGSFGIEFDTGNLPLMTACCDTHDYCYDTCNRGKEECDKGFQQCLLNMCSKMIDDLNKEEQEGCQATAEIMYRGTIALGCTPYKKAQKNACDCGNDMGLEHKTGDHKNKSGTKKPKTTEEKIINTDDQSGQTGDHKNKPDSKKSKNTEEKIIDTNDQSNNQQKSKTQDTKKNKDNKAKQKTSRESGEL